MNTNELKELVDLYVDGELEKSREPLLFTSLADDEEARDYFFSLNVLRSSVEKDMTPFPEHLEENIFGRIKKKESAVQYSFKRNSFVYLAAAVVTAFVIISALLFAEVNSYKSRIEVISEELSAQNRIINLIINNTLPQTEISGRSINEIVIQAN